MDVGSSNRALSFVNVARSALCLMPEESRCVVASVASIENHATHKSASIGRSRIFVAQDVWDVYELRLVAGEKSFSPGLAVSAGLLDSLFE